jgi:hypothetical protein
LGWLVARDIQTDALARYGHSGASNGTEFVNGRLESTRHDGGEVIACIEAADLVLEFGLGFTGHFQTSLMGAAL